MTYNIFYLRICNIFYKFIIRCMWISGFKLTLPQCVDFSLLRNEKIRHPVKHFGRYAPQIEFKCKLAMVVSVEQKSKFTVITIKLTHLFILWMLVPLHNVFNFWVPFRLLKVIQFVVVNSREIVISKPVRKFEHLNDGQWYRILSSTSHPYNPLFKVSDSDEYLPCIQIIFI